MQKSLVQDLCSSQMSFDYINLSLLYRLRQQNSLPLHWLSILSLQFKSIIQKTTSHKPFTRCILLSALKVIIYGQKWRSKVKQFVLETATEACMRNVITQSYLSPSRGSISALTPAVTGRHSIYPPIKDERLSRPELTQVNNLHRVATEVPAISGVGWSSRPSAPLGTVDVNNFPTVVMY